jgi:hypothetical protein
MMRASELALVACVGGVALWYMFCIAKVLQSQRDYLAGELSAATWENNLLYERLTEHGRSTT